MGAYDRDYWKDGQNNGIIDSATRKELDELIDKKLKPMNSRIYELEVRQNVIQNTQLRKSPNRLLRTLPTLLIAVLITFLIYIARIHDIQIFFDGNLISP